VGCLIPGLPSQLALQKLRKASVFVQLLSSIFTQFGGQGGMPGFAAGEGENAAGITAAVPCLRDYVVVSLTHALRGLLCAGGNIDHQGGQEAQFIAQQVNTTQHIRLKPSASAA